MFSDPELVFSTIYRVYYGLPERSAHLKIQWKAAADLLFEDISGKSKTILSARQSVVPIRTTKKFNDYLSSLSDINSNEILATLRLFKDIMEVKEEFSASNTISLFYDHIISQKQDPQFLTQIDAIYLMIKAEFEKRTRRRSLEINSNIDLLYLDFILRCAVLIYYRINSIDFDPWFWFINIIIIPLMIFAFGAFRLKLIQKKRDQILDKFVKIEEFKIKLKRSSSQYTLVALMTAMGIFISYTTSDKMDDQIGAAISAAIGLIIYYSIYLNNFSSGRLKETDFLKQKKNLKDYNQYFDADKNDEVIVETESRLRAITGRLDAYVLESALLGALSFSGFLQIMAQNLISFEDLKTFGLNLSLLLVNSAQFKFTANGEVIAQIMTSKGLFSLVAAETLLCSIFFLMVIAARLRFSNIIDRISQDLSIAKAYNAKEEMMFEKINKEKWAERLSQINKRIGNSLLTANDELNNIKPIHSYIQYFRNAGLMMFFIILISCSFFLSGLISMIFLGLALFTILYFTKQQIQYIIINWREVITNLMINKKHIVLTLSLVMILAGFISRIYFKVEKSYFILATGMILLGLFLILDILVIPVSSGLYIRKPTGKINIDSNRLKLIDWLVISFIILFFTGTLFWIFQYSGFPGEPLSMLGFWFLSASYLYIGFKNYKNRITGIITGFILGIFLLEPFIDAWPDYPLKYFRYSILLLILVLYILIIFKKKPSWLIFKSSTIFIVVFNILYQTEIWGTIRAGYDYFTGTVNEISFIRKTRKKAREIQNELWGEKKACELIPDINKFNLEINQYILKYGDRIKYSNGFEDQVANSYINAAFSASLEKDTCNLQTALSMVQAANGINKLFKFNNDYTSRGGIVEADILNKLGRKDEAIAQLKEIKAMTSDEKFKKDIEKKLDEIISSELKNK